MSPKQLLNKVAKWGLKNGFDVAQELVDEFSAEHPELLTPTHPNAPPTGTAERIDAETKRKIESGEW